MSTKDQEAYGDQQARTIEDLTDRIQDTARHLGNDVWPCKSFVVKDQFQGLEGLMAQLKEAMRL